MIKCIIHTADIHIRNYQRQDEYQAVLTSFIKECKEIVSQYEPEECRIVICGDLTHSKTMVSNELFPITSSFIRELEKICRVIIICGNHDMTQNTDRQDTLSSIFQTAQFTNAWYLDLEYGYESAVVKDDNVQWCLYSIFDDFRRPDIYKEEGITNIGLFHGDIVGSKLYNGTIMQAGVDGGIFEGCDIVLASHIHKRQVLKHNGIDIIFPSSLIQQTFGESVTEHGFCVLTYNEPEKKYAYEFKDLKNEWALYDIEINTIDDLEMNKEQLLNL